MKLTPFAVIYGAPLQTNVILSSLNTLVACSVTEFNAAIAEINTNFANYGYAANPLLPTLPAIPTMAASAPVAIAYLQSTSPGGVRPDFGPSTSYLLIDAFTANGYNDPQAALDLLTAETTLVNVLLALVTLSTAAAVAITVQPTNQSIANNAAGAVALTATGTGAQFEWYIKLPANAYYQRIVTSAIFTTVNTASLTITNPAPQATYNQSKIRAIVRSVTGRQQVGSSIITLTVT